MAHDVFISYSTKDKIIADSLVAALENNNIRCWYAPRDIQPGEDWGSAITRAIENSRVFLVIFSDNSNRSNRVLDEVNLAISQTSVILPFRVEDLEPAGALKLHLSSRHWLDAFEPSWRDHLNPLIKTIASFLDLPVDQDQLGIPPADIKPGRKDVQKKVWLPVLILAAAAVIILGALYLPRLFNRPAADPSLAAEEGSPPSSAAEGGGELSEWRTIAFAIPDDNLWREVDGAYTAVGKKDTIAWSEETFEGDLEISFTMESSISDSAANIIVYGNGWSLASGNLIFTVAREFLAISAHSIYEDGEFLFDTASYVDLQDTEHQVLISIVDRKVDFSLDGALITSIFLSEEISTQGKIGLLKPWDLEDITYSNIRVRN